jgi:hypothetical protein
MKYKLYAAFIASLSVVLTLASNETFGASMAAHGSRSASTHLTFHRSVAQSRHHRRGSHTAAFLPAIGGYYYEPADGEPDLVVREQKTYGDRYTCSLDIPWDWVHRCPSLSEQPPTPVVAVPSVPGCPAQHVTVPMGDGKEQTVSMVRC